MYAKIAQQASTFTKYAASLVAERLTKQTEIDAMRASVESVLASALAAAKAEAPPTARREAPQPPSCEDALRATAADEMEAPLEPLLDSGSARDDETGVALDVLRAAGLACTTLPEGLHSHRVIHRVYQQRARAISGGEGIDWATAEALACATLLADGVSVRLSGQDVERGTFSHRHAVVHDQRHDADGRMHCPLHHYATVHGSDGASFEVHNSPLSEFAVLGFEVGHSLNSPTSLVMWEAQFGDFTNTAQVILDQFICAGEAKWLVKTAIVLLLPHGMEGAGPEHSSARLERYLQLCDDDKRTMPTTTSERCLRRARRTAANMLVVNLTTPANYFHALRRQTAHPTLRKPLVVMAPKTLLRDKRLASPLADFGPGTVFEPVIGEAQPEALAPPPSVRRVLLCSGRIYYELTAEREARGAYDVAIVRVEQLSPFPYQELREEIARWPNAQVVWAQEEAMNYGAWSYVRPRLERVATLCGSPRPTTARGGSAREDSLGVISYIGRNPSAAPATGLLKLHERESRELLEAAFAD